MPSLSERFWSKVDKNGPMHPVLGTNCWDWIGAFTGNNRAYGCIYVIDRNRRAHVVAFFLAHGRWPAPHCLHRCDRSICVRLDHLHEGDHTTNMREAVARGRHVSGFRGKGEESAQAKLTWEQVREIRRRHRAGATGYRLAKDFGMSESQVGNIIHNRQWVE